MTDYFLCSPALHSAPLLQPPLAHLANGVVAWTPKTHPEFKAYTGLSRQGSEFIRTGALGGVVSDSPSCSAMLS